jgi:hypothetical protein
MAATQLFRPQTFEPTKRFLFVGDYVDRGWHSLNTFLYLVCLKLEFPECVYMLRGNHESRQVSTRYGFYHEIILNYGHAGLWMMCMECFDLLPMAALIDTDVFCVHGGLSPKIPMIEKVSLLDRRVELPPQGPLADICWSDPESVSTWRENTRGAGISSAQTNAQSSQGSTGLISSHGRTSSLRRDGRSTSQDRVRSAATASLRSGPRRTTPTSRATRQQLWPSE